MQIREFNKQDATGIRKLVTSILNDEFSTHASAYPEIDLLDITKSYGGERESFYVVEDAGRVVGTAGIKKDSKTVALLRRLFVDRSYRNKGIGSGLVDKAIEFCRQNGYKHIVFRSTDLMSQANNLLLKKGFIEQERLGFGDIQIIRFVLNI